MTIALGSSGGAGGTLMASPIDWPAAARIIGSEYSGENLFDQVASSSDVDDLLALADLTSPTIRAAQGEIDLVPLEDRLYGPGAGLIMSAFSWPGRESRFSDGTFGVFYAAGTIETAIAETTYHQARFLAGLPPVAVEKTVLLVAVQETLVDVRHPQPAPPGIYDPLDYRLAQAFGATVRRQQAFGLAYDSVRDRPAGECVAILRPPALVPPVRVHQTVEYHWDGHGIAVR
ncbi:RES family NAD+ phosphorylase [Gemmatimonas sp.]|uniref:RES family NAD+ phosphorylase n=1 Tax=Gemmatimonas sp. TaxID=1962908 RepID=UPI00286E5B16|nr:RES family NAD+ phosphorylase [Gemmatimonas sp.]